MKVRTSLIGLLVVCGIGVCSIGTAAAQPAGPPAGYKINPEFTKTSPDGAITIEQYEYENKDTDDYKLQFWAPGGHIHSARSGAGRLSSGVSLHQRFAMDRVYAKNRLGRVGALSVPPRSARLRSRDQETAGRPGMGLFQESSRVAKGQEGPRVSHFGESLEGD